MNAEGTMNEGDLFLWGLITLVIMVTVRIAPITIIENKNGDGGFGSLVLWILIDLVMIVTVMIVSFCICCFCRNGEGFIAIGILWVLLAIFIILYLGLAHASYALVIFVAGLIWIAAGKNKINTKRARLAAMRGEGNGGAISPDAVNSAQTVIHNTEGSRRDQVPITQQQRSGGSHYSTLLVDNPQTDPSNVIYARTVPPVEMPGINTRCGDLDMVAPSSNLQSFAIDDNQEDNLERGMEKQV